LLALTLMSLVLYFCTQSVMLRYYFPHTRFFEIGAGALVSFADKETKRSGSLRLGALIMIMGLLFFNKYLGVPLLYKAPLIVLATALFLLPAKPNFVLALLLENKLIRRFGLMSYSLYLWHQPVLAFTRYVYNPDIGGVLMIFVLLIIIALSVISYYCVEQPFRNRERINKTVLFSMLGCMFTLTTAAGLYIYAKAGVMKDVRELDINTTNVARNMHAKYNDRIYGFDKNFTSHNKIKVLIVGHSFARDWANVLTESAYRDNIELSYIYNLNLSADALKRIKEADFIYFSPLDKDNFDILKRKFDIDERKIKITGMKNFGISNGIFYSKRDSPKYCIQRVKPVKIFYRYNASYKAQWGEKYINLMEMVSDKNGTLPVFTPNCKFISQDCKHFTRAGAAYYATLINGKLPELEKR